MKRCLGLILAGVALCAAADTLTWSATTGGNWSDAANWTSDGSHAVPQSGDRVVVALSAGSASTNNLSSLSLSHFKMVFRRDGVQGTSGRKFITFRGNPITLTGGLDALKSDSVSAGSVHESDYAISCYIPFVLSDAQAGGTNKFDLVCRYTQYGALSGPGMLWLACGGVASTLKCENTCAGGSYLTGSNIFDLEHAKGLGNGSVKAVHALTGTMVRLYSNCDAWLDVRPPTTLPDSYYTFGVYANWAFNGPITGTRFVLKAFSPSLTTTVDGDIDVEGPVHVSRDSGSANYSVVYNGRVRCQDFGRLYQAAAGRVTFNHADNDIANFYSLYQNAYAGAVNCFGTNAVVRFRENSDAYGVMDLCGFDQRINRITLNGSYVVTGEEGHLITSSSPATLTMAATESTVCDAKFGGALSLVWAPRGNYSFQTYADCGRSMPMTGALVVSNGTFEVNGANAFPQASSLVVADGASFVWASSVKEGLHGLSALKVGENARFEIAGGAELPFTQKAYRSGLVLDLSTSARFLLVDGVEVPVSGLSTNGVALPVGTVVSGTAAEGVVVLPQLAGCSARIRITGITPGEKVQLSAKAYVKDGLVCHLDGIENAGYGTFDATAAVWKDLAETAGDFTVDATVGTFTGTSLKKIKSGCLGRNNTVRSGVLTLEAAVSGAAAAGTGVVMPIFLGSDQNIIWQDKSDGYRYLAVDKLHLGWKMASRPSNVTIAAVYASSTQASGFYQNGIVPEGESYAGETFSGNNNPSGGMTLGGRTITWNGSDTGPYGYELNAVRMYNRALSPSEVTNNWVVDTYRFHGTLPAETENYRYSPNGEGVLECRLTVSVAGADVLVNGEPLSAEGYWAELGETVSLTIRPDASHTFGSWMGDLDAVVGGTADDASIQVRVNRSLSFGANMASSLLIVSGDTNLTQNVSCSGIRFLGAYMVSAAEDCSLTIDENGSGIEIVDGVAGTATIACPLAIGSLFGGTVQTVQIPETATLLMTGNLTGKAPLAFAGSGTFKTQGLASDYAGDLALSNGVVSVSGRFLASDAKLSMYNRAQVRFNGAEVGGTIIGYQTANYSWFAVEGNTSNYLRGGIVTKTTGVTPQWSISFGTGSRLFIERNFSNSAGSYVTPSGPGELHLTNITYTSTMVGAYQPGKDVVTHLWQPNALLVNNHLSASGNLISHAANTLGHSPLRLMNCAWDLGGFDQTSGRLSWMDSYANSEIRSTEPATLRIYQDKQSGSGSNRGSVTYLGRLTGQVSLVKTGNETSKATADQVAEDLVLGSAIASKGEVGVVWGLLSFTNGTGRVGSWLNCPRATAGGTTDAFGNAHVGILELLHSQVFDKSVDVHVKDGGKVRLGAGVSQRVSELYLDGSETPAVHGFWGSSSSSATHKDDAHFEGTGVLYVTGPNEPGTIFVFR